MPEKNEDEEIVVDTSPRRRRGKPLLRDTTVAEAFDFRLASARIGKRLSSLMIVVGALLAFFSVYGLLTSVSFLLSDVLFVGVLGILGVLNIFYGLVLIAKE